MKGNGIWIMVVGILLLWTPLVSANAGPTYWKGYPSWESMTIHENSPIGVTKEELIFDFSQGEGMGAARGEVRATYQMTNPSEKAQWVQMAFPFVGNLRQGEEEEIQIKVDDQAIPFEIFVGERVEGQGSAYDEPNGENYDIEDLLRSIRREPYQAKTFQEQEKCKLYSINVTPPTNQKIKLAVSFSYDRDQTKILTHGFHHMELGEGRTRIAAWCEQPTVLEIYVLGEDIDIDLKAYSDGELEKEIPFSDYGLESQEGQFGSFLKDYIENDAGPDFKDALSENQRYNFYARVLDEEFMRNPGVVPLEDLLGRNEECILVLAYQVDFPENSEREVQVNYQTTTTMDRRRTRDPLYTVDYLLNPARYWSHFQNLTIKVLPGKEQPYMIRSNMDFQREGSIYTASYDQLPETDLSFTLYSRERITWWDQWMGSLHHRFGYFTPIVIGVVVLLLFIILYRVIRAQRRG